MRRRWLQLTTIEFIIVIVIILGLAWWAIPQYGNYYKAHPVSSTQRD